MKPKSDKSHNASASSPDRGRRVFLGIGLAATAAWLGRSRASSLSSPAPTGEVSIEQFSAAGKSEGLIKLAKVIRTDAEWRSQLSPAAYQVTRRAGTELPFSGEYDGNRADGLYRCVCCDTALYDSHTMFDSGTGWPSFWQPISRANILTSSDDSLGMHRDAVACRRCDAHLGHVFDDGPRPTGLRYCMNSVALHFVPRARA